MFPAGFVVNWLSLQQRPGKSTFCCQARVLVHSNSEELVTIMRGGLREVHNSKHLDAPIPLFA